MITPGAEGAEPDKFREFYNTNMKPHVVKTVDEAIANPGPTPMELLEAERELTLNFGYVPPVTKSIYGTGFATQMKYVFQRKMKLVMRDPEVIGATVIMNTFLGIVMGVMFFDVGSTEPKGAAQLAYLFNVLMQVAMGSMNIMPALIAERTIMKVEADEALYSPWAFIWTTFFVMGFISFIGNSIFILLMWAFGNIGWEPFGMTYVWIMLAWFSMDSIFAAVAATAKKIESAQAIAMPPLLIAIMFSGLMINKNSKTPLKFLCNVSPLYWVTELIAWDAYGDDPAAWNNLKVMYGFEEPVAAVGVAVNVGIALFFRVLQVLALKYLNKIEK